MSGNRIHAAWVVIAALLPASALAQQAAGQVLWLSGQVASIDGQGIARALAKGDPVRQGDMVRTGPDSHAQLLMNDQGLIALRPESSLRVAAYAYDGRKDGSQRALLELLRGGMRSITGAIGLASKENYKLETETASIGIRGTDHETFVVPGSGTYNRVTLGGTYLQNPHGRVELAPGDIGFAAVLSGSAPAQLERTPTFMHLAALTGPSTGPVMRGSGRGDEIRLQTPMGAPFNEGVIAHAKRELPGHVTMPALPAQVLGDNSAWTTSGKCVGPCASQAGGIGKGTSTGQGRP
jgi:hypothetical protein